MFVNKKICFIEKNEDNIQSEDINYHNTDNSGPLEAFLEKFQENIITSQDNVSANFKISFCAGVFSTLYKNNIINSKIYNLDSVIINEGIFLPFNDTIKNKNIECVNPKIFKKTLGVGISEDFDDIYITPFNDLPNLEIEKNFKDLYTPNYYNAYSVHDLFNSISVIGQLEEIRGINTTEKVLKGVTSEITSSGTDARNRSLIINQEIITRRNLVYENNIEPFLEHEETFNQENLQKYNFEYDSINVNGLNYNILKLGENSFTYKRRLSPNIMYYNEEINDIIPFDDSLTEEDYNIVKISSGSYIDNSILLGSDSLGFIGEID